MSKLIINTDGGSRGNPGPAAIGVVVSDSSGKQIHNYCEFIGIGTNNEAEYEALIRAFEIVDKSNWLKENIGNESEIECKLDSKLVVEQVKGNFKIKQPHLQELYHCIKKITSDWKIKLTYTHIPREENKAADKLVNQALDEKLKNKAG